MRIPLTRDGLGVLAVATALLGLAGLLLAWLTPWCWLAVAVVWVWAVSFFRDPERRIDHQSDTLYAPADGRVTEVSELESHPEYDGPCLRVRIFLSIFNVHINRMPCAASVKSAKRRPGRYLNAMNPQSAEDNESNTLVLEPQAPWSGPIVVRQISGLIVRTIVCHAGEGDRLLSGQRFGMIRFGSGTELVCPRTPGLRLLVRPGQSVRAGLTAMAVLAEPVAGGQ